MLWRSGLLAVSCKCYTGNSVTINFKPVHIFTSCKVSSETVLAADFSNTYFRFETLETLWAVNVISSSPYIDCIVPGFFLFQKDAVRIVE